MDFGKWLQKQRPQPPQSPSGGLLLKSVWPSSKEHKKALVDALAKVYTPPTPPAEEYEDLPWGPSPARRMATALLPGVKAIGRMYGYSVSTDFDFDHTIAQYKFRHPNRSVSPLVLALYEDQLLNPDYAQITKTITLALEAQLETARRLGRLSASNPVGVKSAK